MKTLKNNIQLQQCFYVIALLFLLFYNSSFGINLKNITLEKGDFMMNFFEGNQGKCQQVLVGLEHETKLSLKLALGALRIAKREKDTVGIEYNTTLIGGIFYKSTNYNKALVYFKQALVHSKRLKNFKKVTKNQLEIGRTYIFLKQLDSARIFLKKVIEVKDVSKEIGTMKAHAYSNLSGILFKKNSLDDLKKGKDYALKAIEIHKKYENIMFQASSFANLGSNYYAKTQYSQAKTYYLKALNLLNNRNSYEEKRFKETIYENLGWTLHNLGDSKGFSYINKSAVLRDSLQKMNHHKEILEIEAKHNVAMAKKEEVVKKERAERLNYFLGVFSSVLLVLVVILYRNMRLKRKNREKELEIEEKELENRRQNNVLNATIDEKEAQEKKITEALHDSTIQYLGAANMYLGAVRKGKNSETITAIKNIIEKASKTLYDISDDLVSTALLNFGLSTAVENLCKEYTTKTLAINSISKNIARYDADFEIKVYNIVHELLKNTVTHSHASKGMITLEEKGESLLLRAIDNGQGFQENQLRKQYGIGLAQIEARIKKMKGAFTIHSANGDGTNISMSIPLPSSLSSEEFVLSAS